jgi:hypothetical protein
MIKNILILLGIIALAQGCASPKYSISKPVEFALGDSVSSIKEKLTNKCTNIIEKDIIPITAPLAKESQKQIDCFGFKYAGIPRKVELVFQDDQLDIVWILFPAEEREELISNFTSTYGEPSMTIEFGTIYLQANAAIRNQPSEVIFASDRQVKMMLKSLSKTQ